MEARLDTITDAHRATCEWLLHNVDYAAWRDTRQRFPEADVFWITGNPGTGKSTLMKFAFEHARHERRGDEVLVAFFFNARGHELERSTLGLYRSIAAQILQQAPEAQEVLNKRAYRPPWTVQISQNLISAALKLLRSRHLKCFFDALDEGVEQDIRDMILFFEESKSHMAAESTLSICFASRHYPTINFRQGRRIVVEREQGHSEDMQRYIQHHLQVPETAAGRGIQQEICSRANGIFMWVVLVVKILNREIDHGRMYTIKQRLRAIPQKLSDLFRDILTRDESDMDELLLCLQWILFAAHPLEAEEFYFAMEAGRHLTTVGWEPGPWTKDGVDPDTMIRFVVDTSKGLAEVSKSDTSTTVQFIHESVRDFLLGDGGLCNLWPHLSGTISSSSHERLRQCCQTYISPAVLYAVTHKDPLVCRSPGVFNAASGFKVYPNGTFTVLSSWNPFLDYAVRAVLFHAEQAGRNVSQYDFVSTFPLSTWIELDRLRQGPFRHFSVDAFSRDTTLAYVSGVFNYPNLLQSTDTRSHWRRVSSMFDYPFAAAFFMRGRKALEVLLPGISPAELANLINSPGYGNTTAAMGSVLLWAARHNLTFLEYLLIHLEQNDPFWSSNCQYLDESRPCSGERATVLAILAETGQADLVQLILDKGSAMEPGGLSSALKIATPWS